MKALPSEILSLTFQHLDTKELLQCQLTCKGWYESSVDLLYSKITLFSRESFTLYVRTISNSPSLGGYLKEINTCGLLRKLTYRNKRLWTEHELVDTMLKHCPNLQVFSGNEIDSTFWSQISYAASQGQLTRLQVLPDFSDDSIENYLYTALLFKSTLTRLQVSYMGRRRYGINLNHLVPYQMFLDQSREFKNLQTLIVFCSSDSQLSYYDSLIDNCPQLTELAIELCPIKDERSEIELGTINPNPKIQKLTCTWSMMNSEIQLRYVMQKFTNLHYFKLARIKSEYTATTVYFPIHVATDLLRFVLSIPNFCVKFPLRRQYVAKFWTELMNMNDAFRDISITYMDDEIIPEDNERRETETLEKEDVHLDIERTSSKIYFNCSEEEIGWLITIFFPEVGSKIRSLVVSLEIDDSYQINWIFQILKSCPSLQELSVPADLDTDLSDHLKFQHMELKKLTVTEMDAGDSLDFLECMSLYLPNMICIELDCLHFHNLKDPVTIHMSNTSLDQLIWVNINFTTWFRDNFGFYIRLNLDSGTTFYYSGYLGCVKVNEELYNKKPPGNFYMDITCRNLKEIVLRCLKHLPHKLDLIVVFQALVKK